MPPPQLQLIPDPTMERHTISDFRAVQTEATTPSRPPMDIDRLHGAVPLPTLLAEIRAAVVAERAETINQIVRIHREAIDTAVEETARVQEEVTAQALSRLTTRLVFGVSAVIILASAVGAFATWLAS